MTSQREIRRLFEPATESSVRRSLTPIWVLALGVLSVIMLLWTHSISERRTEQNLAVAKAVTDLQIAVAYWHLWLEEHLTGDPYIDLDLHVRRNQDLSMRLASSLLRGGERDNGDVVLPLREPALRTVAEALEAALTDFRDLSDDRQRRPREEAGVGTPLDEEFDARFHRVREHALELRRLYDERLERDRDDFRLRVWLTVGAWMVIVTAAVAGLWGRERRRQEAEEALRASQKWLATTLASIGDAVVTTDLQGRILFVNPVAEQLTGWRREEASGHPIEEVIALFRASDHQPAENPVSKVLRSGESLNMSNHTLLVDRQQENCYAIDEGAAPIRDEDGHLLGVVVVFRDVSQRRQTEKALRQREAELQQAQKMEAVGRLAGGIAHDVNNYLGAIRGYCEVAILKDESGEALRRRMSAAVDTADKVSALIRQLLAFSRRQPVQAELVDLNRVVRNLEDLMVRLLGEDIALDTSLASDLSSIEIDPSQIEQIFVNLLVNARDAMPTGGSITVETGDAEVGAAMVEPHPAAKPGRFVRLKVVDDGCGMPQEVLEKIFDPFFTTKAGSGSSGLGLATVYAIVEQNRGFIQVESAPGEGTTFEIYLPAGERRAPPSTSDGAEPVRRTGPVRVLLVEDNEDMRASTRALLEVLGHQVSVAHDGPGALELLAENDLTFDLLITDVIMPKMSGKELYERVCELQGGDVRCLFISGYTDNVMLRHGVVQDRVHFLQKPFGFDALARKIGEVLEASTTGPG